MDTLVNILGGDPAVYGQYFPEMVQTSVNAVYPIANYGSAMTPFYTVLAIWVGGVILSSLIKIHARTRASGIGDDGYDLTSCSGGIK